MHSPPVMTLPTVILQLVGFGLTACIPRANFAASGKVSGEIPADASPIIDPDFPGLAFEEASFVRYAQDDDGNVNAFSTNLMEAIYSRTGGKPIIRLGGTSPDYGKYLPGQVEPALPVAEQDSFQDVGHTTIGPSYWVLAKNFPNASYMIEVPLATTNISEPIAWVQSAVETIGLDKIHSIQPGNEADLYRDDYTGEGGIPLQPPEYQGTLNNETCYVRAIKEAVPLISDGRFFTAFDVGTHFGADVEKESYVFAVDRCFSLGIDEGDVIKEVSHHYYQKVAGQASDLGNELMNLSMTHTHLDQYKVRIDWLRENKPDIPFILNEVGNSLQPQNTYEYQARLGSALWQVDFYLYAMSIGVARINYQQIMHAGYDMWLPVASAGFEAQVFSNFYSQPLMGDFIGSSGKTQIARLDLAVDPAAPNVAAYAAYEDGVAKRIAVANLNYWNASSSTEPRGGVTLEMQLPPGGNDGTVTVYRLGSPEGAGAAADSITYGGSQWTYESLGREVKGVRNDTEEIPVSSDGVVSIRIPSSEAVLVWL